MRFLVRKRRTAPAVIIVALIDVLIVLVIFLLVTTTFKQQPAMHLTLPDSTQALKSGANANPPLVVSIGADGVFRVGANNDVSCRINCADGCNRKPLGIRSSSSPCAPTKVRRGAAS